jgi:adenosine deaminase
MRADDATDLPAYLSRFETSHFPSSRREDALARVTRELVEDHAAEGVRLVEIRYAPVLNTEGGLSAEAVLEATLEGMRQGSEQTGIQAGLILCGIRNMDPATSVEHGRTRRWPSGTGGWWPSTWPAPRRATRPPHAEAFEVAARDAPPGHHPRRGGVGGRLHPRGPAPWDAPPVSATGPGSTRTKRSSWPGSGTGVPLEICLTSNVQTRVASTFEAHPVRRYFDEGILLTLCTDNRLVSGVSLVDEYARAAVHLGFTWEELTRVARMGFEAAFLPWDEKRRLLTAFDAEVAAPG